MKKIVFLFLGGLFCSTLATAQPTITHNMHGHQIGDVVEWWNMSIPADTALPGGSGPDQVWDFSAYTSSYSFSNEYVDPANTPFAAQASGSNLAVYHNIPNNDAYTFCDITGQHMLHTGGGWIETGMELYYDFTDPVTVQTFPFSYEDEYSDGYSYSIDYNQLGYDMVVMISGTLSVLADAWGEIHTPLGTYGNVLRVKEVYTETVSTYIEGQLINTSAVVENFYKWYAPNRRASVFEYHFIAGEEDSHAILYADNMVGVSEKHGVDIEVFPNPASSYIRIKLKTEREVLSIQMVNAYGQVLKHVDPMTIRLEQFTLGVADLVNGLYFLTIKTTRGKEINHKVMISH